MKKRICSAIVAAGLALAGSAFAQGSGLDSQPGGNAGPSYGPPVGTPDYYDNSGWTPPLAYPGYYGNRRSGAGPAYPYVRERDRIERERAGRREWGDRRERRDRDGDGVRNNRDRHPDDPSRY